MAPILAEHFALTLQRFKPARKVDKDRDGSPIINSILVVLILVGSIISLPWLKNYLPFPGNKAGLISAETPVEATQYLVGENLGRELFNEIGFGSYLIWAAYPQYQVFVDPRIELYPLETWFDYISLSQAQFGWQELIDSYGVNTLMLQPENQAPLISALQSAGDWQQVYEDHSAVIFTYRGK